MIDNQAILLAYEDISMIKKEIAVEMLFARSFITDTKGLSTFKVVSDYFDKKEIPVANMSTCLTSCQVRLAYWIFSPTQEKSARGNHNSLCHSSATLSCKKLKWHPA